MTGCRSQLFTPRSPGVLCWPGGGGGQDTMQGAAPATSVRHELWCGDPFHFGSHPPIKCFPFTSESLLSIDVVIHCYLGDFLKMLFSYFWELSPLSYHLNCLINQFCNKRRNPWLLLIANVSSWSWFWFTFASETHHSIICRINCQFSRPEN